MEFVLINEIFVQLKFNEPIPCYKIRLQRYYNPIYFWLSVRVLARTIALCNSLHACKTWWARMRAKNYIHNPIDPHWQPTGLVTSMHNYIFIHNILNIFVRKGGRVKIIVWPLRWPPKMMKMKVGTATYDIFLHLSLALGLPNPHVDDITLNL